MNEDQRETCKSLDHLACTSEELLPLVYEELRKLAAQKLACERPGQTLQPTALVHEAYLRLVANGRNAQWNSRGHFFAAAAEAIRRILVENARHKQRIRHGGEVHRLDIDPLTLVAEAADKRLLDLDEALERLAEEEPMAAQVVKLRYFAGLTIEDTANALDIAVRTVSRHWAFGKARLYQQLRQDDQTHG